MAAGGDIPALVTRLKGTQRLRDETAALAADLAVWEQPEALDVAAWLEETRELLGDLRATLETDPAGGRGVLRCLLATPVAVSPHLDEQGRVFEWEYLGEATPDLIVAGRVPAAKKGGVVVRPLPVPWHREPDIIIRRRPAGLVKIATGYLSNCPQLLWSSRG